MSYDVTSIDQTFLRSVQRSYGTPQEPSVPAPSVPDKAEVSTDKDLGDRVFGEDGLTFEDVLDTLNPLQHLPVVSTLYREATGDDISGASRVAGGTLYGGVFGLIGSAVNWLVEETTGDDIGGHVMAAFGLDDWNADDTAPDGTAPDGTGPEGTAVAAADLDDGSDPVTILSYSDAGLSGAPAVEPLTITGREAPPAQPFQPFAPLTPLTVSEAVQNPTPTQQAFLADPIAFVLGDAPPAPQHVAQHQMSPEPSLQPTASTPNSTAGSDAGRIGVWDHAAFEFPPVFEPAVHASAQQATAASFSLTPEHLQALRAYQSDMTRLQDALLDAAEP